MSLVLLASQYGSNSNDEKMVEMVAKCSQNVLPD